MENKKHRFIRCPKCKKKGELMEGQSFIYYHMCKHEDEERIRKWSGNSGRLVGEVYTEEDSVW